MPGRESNLPSHKERKNLKRQGQKPRGRVGVDYLLPKYEPSTDEVSGKSLPTGYEASKGHYARLSTPSPVRGNTFDDQPDRLLAEAPSPPRRYSFEDSSYSTQNHGPGA